MSKTSSRSSCLCLDKEYIMKEEMKNRRKLRLLQVRQQNQAIASQIRSNVGQKKDQELQKIVNCLEKKFYRKQQASIESAKENYCEGLGGVGHAQGYARTFADEHVFDEARLQQDRAVAAKRHQKALARLHQSAEQDAKAKVVEHNRKNMIKKKEEVRAKQVAMLARSKLADSDATDSTSGTSSWESSRFSTSTGGSTSRNSSDKSFKSKSTVSRPQSSRSSSHHNRTTSSTHAAVKHEGEYDARGAAHEEEERLDDLQKERGIVALAMQEKAQLRQNAALKQAKLQREFQQLEEELNQLRRIV